MRYFVLIWILFIVGVISQTQIQSEALAIDEAQFFYTDEKDKTNNLGKEYDSFPNEISLIKSSPDDHQQQQKSFVKNQNIQHHKKHHKREHPKQSHYDHNQFLHPPSFQQTQQSAQKHPYHADQQRDSIYSLQNDEQSGDKHYQRLRLKHHKKFWNKKSFKHIIFLIILIAVAFFLVRKCVTKRTHQNRRILQSTQHNLNPATIDEEIQRHFAEIQRLQQLKGSIEAQRRQLEEQPIIYQEPYRQQFMMDNSLGRMVNENCYPRNFHQNIEMQNIPVGIPIMIRNPYNQPQVYRNF